MGYGSSSSSSSKKCLDNETVVLQVRSENEKLAVGCCQNGIVEMQRIETYDDDCDGEIVDRPKTVTVAKRWLVVLASFLCNGIIFGTINSYGLIYTELQKRLLLAGIIEASSQAALIGSITIGATFVVSPLASMLSDRYSLRRVAVCGGLLAATGMVMSSLRPNDIRTLAIGYGIMFGSGASLVYTPSLAVLGNYFDRCLGTVNGFVTTGSSIFTITLPYLLQWLLENRPFADTFRFLAVLTFILAGASTVFTGNSCRRKAANTKKPKTVAVLDTNDNLFESRIPIWRNARYLIWAFMTSVALLGYFVPYVHMAKYVQITFPGNDIKLPTIVMGLSSGMGRIIFGFVGDFERINRIALQQLAFISIGTMTMLLPIINDFNWFLGTIFIMGIFDGCFISSLGPIAFQLCGQKEATQAIGFQLGLSSMPLMFGPPLAGLLYDRCGSYTWPFLLSGVPPIIGAALMSFVYCVRPVTELNVHKNHHEELQNKQQQIAFLSNDLSSNL